MATGDWKVKYDDFSQLTNAEYPEFATGTIWHKYQESVFQPGMLQYINDEHINDGTIGGGSGGADALKTIKKAIRKIKDTEVIAFEDLAVVNTTIEKYEKAGLAKQAELMRTKARLSGRIARIKEWDYPVLPFKAIEKYHHSIHNTYYHDVHMSSVAEYSKGIMPEAIVDKLLEATDRQVFDSFDVLWVEKVKDPLLLGKIKESKDYYFIAEWGDDVTFEEIMKNVKKKVRK